MKRITVSLSVTDEAWSRFDGVGDLETSLIARLSEVYDRNGDPITPNLTGVTLEEEEDPEQSSY